MPQFLPEHPDLAQLRRQAKELHRAATAGVADALDRIHGVSPRTTLTAAQLAIARQYGFGSWRRLKVEVERKSMIEEGDIDGLARLVAAHPDLATEGISSCYQDDPTATALSYLGVAGWHGLTNHDRAGEMARVLLSAGASVDGAPGCPETPLITAASYGELDMARALIQAGAQLERTGVALPGGTALTHAVQFGWPEIVDLLVAAGSVVHNIFEAAGTGDLRDFLTPATTTAEKARALRAASVCERLEVIDQLLAAGLTVDADPDTGADPGANTALHWAAWEGKPTSVRHLLARGADPNRHDADFNMAPLGWCRHRHAEIGARIAHGHVEVERILEPITTGEQPDRNRRP